MHRRQKIIERLNLLAGIILTVLLISPIPCIAQEKQGDGPASGEARKEGPRNLPEKLIITGVLVDERNLPAIGKGISLFGEERKNAFGDDVTEMKGSGKTDNNGRFVISVNRGLLNSRENYSLKSGYTNRYGFTKYMWLKNAKRFPVILNFDIKAEKFDTGTIYYME